MSRTLVMVALVPLLVVSAVIGGVVSLTILAVAASLIPAVLIAGFITLVAGSLWEYVTNRVTPRGRAYIRIQKELGYSTGWVYFAKGIFLPVALAIGGPTTVIAVVALFMRFG
jgi:hypothetical protein